MAKYKICGMGVKREDGASIPLDLANRDWQEYLVWVSEGNTPDPEFSFSEKKDKKIADLMSGAETVIFIDYPLTNQTSLINLKLGAAGERLMQINAIDMWIASVLTEYYVRKATVEAATTEEQLNAVSTDFTPFLASQPPYTLRTVLLAPNA